MCEVHEVGPHLWLAAAKGLGFYVHTVRFKDADFQRIPSDPGLSPKFAKWGA